MPIFTLHTMHEEAQTIWLNRVFPFSQHVLYNAWTNARHVQHWWGPYHFTNPVCIVEPEKNGLISIHTCSPDGMLFPLSGNCIEARHPYKFVFSSLTFEDEGGEGLMNRNTVLFLPLGNKTMVYLESEILHANTITKGWMHTLEQSWLQSFEKLDAYLKSGLI